MPAAVYRFQQVSKQHQQQGGEDEQEEEQAQSVDMWLLTDSTLAQLMDPQLAAPVVQFMVLEVLTHLLHKINLKSFCIAARTND